MTTTDPTAAPATALSRGVGVPPSDPDPRGAGRRRVSLDAQRGRPGFWFVSPFIVVLTLFMLVPVAYAIWTSLFTTRLIGGTTFSGLANYRQVLSSGPFWSGAGRVTVFAVVQVPVTIGLALFFAAVFDAGVVRFGRAMRTIYFIPFAVPAVVASIMWSFLLLPRFGPYTRIAAGLGLGQVDFFSSHLLLATIIIIAVWEWTGYNMTILYTSLKSVPREVTEAALLDGASFWRIVARVKVPMVGPSITMLVFLNVIGALQLFTEPSILAAFQPQAVSFGYTPSLFVYNTAIGSSEYNLGAAAAVLVGLAIAAVSLAGSRLRGRSGAVR